MSFFIFPNTNLQIATQAPQRSRTCQVCLSFLLIRFLNKSKNSCFHLPWIIQRLFLFMLPIEAIPTERTLNSWHSKGLGAFLLSSLLSICSPTLGEQKRMASPVPYCLSLFPLPPACPLDWALWEQKRRIQSLPSLLFPLAWFPTLP